MKYVVTSRYGFTTLFVQKPVFHLMQHVSGSQRRKFIFLERTININLNFVEIAIRVEILLRDQTLKKFYHHWESNPHVQFCREHLIHRTKSLKRYVIDHSSMGRSDVKYAPVRTNVRVRFSVVAKLLKFLLL